MAATDAELKALTRMMGLHRSEVDFKHSIAISQLESDRCLEVKDGVILATEKGQLLINRYLTRKLT